MARNGQKTAIGAGGWGRLPLISSIEVVSLKWYVGFENGRKMTPIFTIIFISKMLILQCITSLKHTFLVDGMNEQSGI